jgi:hypothetical protein
VSATPQDVPGVGVAEGALEAVWPGGIRAAIAVGPVLAEGGDARIHALDGRDDLVAKLYRVPDTRRRAKLDAMLAAPPEGRTAEHGGQRYVELAWPVALVEAGPPAGAPPTAPSDGGPALGLLMPRVDVGRAVLLELFLSARARRAEGLPESVRARVTVAHNLAAAVAALHAAGHYVVDLKPANVHVYRDTQFVAVLDCDGFSIAGPDGARFPARQYTPGYVAPEGRDARPEALGEAQDRFALAVVVFQLLNRGLHPFQGVPAAGATVPGTDAERIAAGLYPYRPGAALAPPPQSRYAFFDDRTRALFDAAFSGDPAGRPSAALWRDHLRALLVGRLRPCDVDPDHARYGDAPCGTCALDREQAALVAATAARMVPPPPPPPEEPAPVLPSVTLPRSGGSNRMQKILIAFFALLFFISISNQGSDSPDEPPRDIATLQLVAAIESGSLRQAQSQLGDPAVLRGDVQSPEFATGPGREAAYGPVRESVSVLDAAPGLGCWVATGATAVQRPSMLRLAAQRGHASMVRLLLRYGAQPNGFDAHLGTTALMAAAAQCTSDLDPGDPALDALAAAQRFDLPNLDRWIEFDRQLASVRDSDGLRDVIARRAADSTDAVGIQQSLAQLISNASVVQALITGGANVNATDRWGRTALFYAAAAGNTLAVRLLVAAGADPNALDVASTTPLMAAADQATTPESDRVAAAVVFELLRAGAIPRLDYGSGRTAAEFVGDRPATALFRLHARADSAASSLFEAPPDPLGRSRTLAILRWAEADTAETGPRTAAALAPALALAPVAYDRTRSADLGDGRTVFASTIDTQVPVGVQPPPSKLFVGACEAMVESGIYHVRVTYERSGTAGLGHLWDLRPLDWPSLGQTRRGAVPSVSEAPAADPGIIPAPCYEQISEQLGRVTDLSGEAERWPVRDVAVEIVSSTMTAKQVPPPPPLQPLR